jgi:hypothetical protein
LSGDALSGAGWTFEQLVAAEAGFDDVGALPDDDCDAEALFALQSELLHDVLPAVTRVAAQLRSARGVPVSLPPGMSVTKLVSRRAVLTELAAFYQRRGDERRATRARRTAAALPVECDVGDVVEASFDVRSLRAALRGEASLVRVGSGSDVVEVLLGPLRVRSRGGDVEASLTCTTDSGTIVVGPLQLGRRCDTTA